MLLEENNQKYDIRCIKCNCTLSLISTNTGIFYFRCTNCKKDKSKFCLNIVNCYTKGD
jgi:hypothetical protein